MTTIVVYLLIAFLLFENSATASKQSIHRVLKGEAKSEREGNGDESKGKNKEEKVKSAPIASFPAEAPSSSPSCLECDDGAQQYPVDDISVPKNEGELHDADDKPSKSGSMNLFENEAGFETASNGSVAPSSPATHAPVARLMDYQTEFPAEAPINPESSTALGSTLQQQSSKSNSATSPILSWVCTTHLALLAAFFVH